MGRLRKGRYQGGSIFPIQRTPSVCLRLRKMRGGFYHFLLVLLLALADMAEPFHDKRVAAADLMLPWLAASKHAGIMHYFCDIFFLAVSHNMDAGNTFDLLHLVDDIDAELLAFLLLICCSLDAFDDRVGNMHARHVERIQRAALAEANGPTPTRMKHFSCKPRSRTLCIYSRNIGTS